MKIIKRKIKAANYLSWVVILGILGYTIGININYDKYVLNPFTATSE